MSTSSISAASTTAANLNSANVSSTTRGTLTQEDFLTLLLTQMQYQDPLNPMDNYQMSSQMAQLGTIEGINKLVKSMELMQTYQASTTNLQMAGLIGKKVETSGNLFVIEQGKVSEASYQLSKSGKVTVEIYDRKGQLVRTINEGAKGPSKQKFSWDGKDAQGNVLSDGSYTFSVKAVDEKGQSISANTSMIGTVSGISFENGIPSITIGSAKLTVADILAIVG
jgi:flagellar basal-body rod modification protein FlgD